MATNLSNQATHALLYPNSPVFCLAQLRRGDRSSCRTKTCSTSWREACPSEEQPKPEKCAQEQTCQRTGSDSTPPAVRIIERVSYGMQRIDSSNSQTTCGNDIRPSSFSSEFSSSFSSSNINRREEKQHKRRPDKARHGKTTHKQDTDGLVGFLKSKRVFGIQ